MKTRGYIRDVKVDFSDHNCCHETRDNFQCVLCGRRPPEVELFVDHIKPVARGGDNSPNNLRTLCFECNAGKGVDEE